MAYFAITMAFFAFAVIIMAAALAHHLNHVDGVCDDPDCQCHLWANDDYYDDEDEEPLCEDGCNADGVHGECTKCGWIDHLAQLNKTQEGAK